MPMIDYVDVRIQVNGQSLREYLDPAESDGERTRSRYIQAAVGERFHVVVRLLQNFELHSAPWVGSEFVIDDSPVYLTNHVANHNLYHSNGELWKPHVLADRSCITTWDDAIGSWMECEFEFGPLGTTEDTCNARKLSPKAVSTIGSINVKVFRAKTQPREQGWLWKGNTLESVDELPEKALKGRDVKMNTKYVPVKQGAAPGKSYVELVPITGRHGEFYEFTFLYRTAKALQSLGCIKDSSAPRRDPDTKLMLDRKDYVIENLLARVEELEIARNNPTVKAEPGKTVSGRSKSPRVKREREISNSARASSSNQGHNGAEDDDEPTVTAPPPAPPREVIKLISDDEEPVKPFEPQAQKPKKNTKSKRKPRSKPVMWSEL